MSLVAARSPFARTARMTFAPEPDSSWRSSTSAREAAGTALRKAGMAVVEVADWKEAAEALRQAEASLLVCDGELLGDLGSGAARAVLTQEAARSLSHALRTPLSAMAGW